MYNQMVLMVILLKDPFFDGFPTNCTIASNTISGNQYGIQVGENYC